MSQSASLSSGVADRYASALFELALADKKLDQVEGDLERFDDLLQSSEDMRRLVNSPVFSTDEQVRAIGGVLDKMKITGLQLSCHQQLVIDWIHLYLLKSP